MAKKVFKYSLDERVLMHKDAEILSVGLQDGKWKLWALVDPDNSKEYRSFQFLETGNELNDINLLVKPKHIGTTISHGDKYVLHIFENVKI